MEKSNSYVYFAFHGETFDPSIITKQLNISPTDSWIKGDPSKYAAQQPRALKKQYSHWQLSSIQSEILDIDKLVNEVIDQLADKTDEINKLKLDFNLHTVLEIVLYIDVNEEYSTPMIGHDLRTIEFLHSTGTVTDVDIYRYDSRE